MNSQRSTSIIWLLLLQIIRLVSSRPYLLLRNKAPKCFMVEPPRQTTLIINYKAPDLVMAEDEKVRPTILDGEAEEMARHVEDGVDIMYKERLARRMETLKQANLRDINISVTPRDSSGAMLSVRPPSDGDIDEGKYPVKKREQIETKEGAFEYYFGDINGFLEICIQSYTATGERPSRVAIEIHIETENEAIEKQLEAERLLLKKRQEQIETENEILEEETSRITQELVRMHRRAKSIAGDAQFSKAREETFQQQSQILNRAVKYWPIVRIVVLIIGGYMQVTHVIQYMKSRHIY